MRARDNKKRRGDIFEEFCILYLQHVCGYEKVWLLADVPEEILVKLSMKRRDMGIDIVVEHEGNYMAVQCKYKKHTERKNSVSWTALSTFYALCLRTGPWHKYIVMTTADFARHEGKRTEKDVSICLGTFRGISQDHWVKICGMEGHLLAESTNLLVKRLSPEELRAARLARFS
jgi:predicted helicase